jgi:DNA-binding transcriptional ArsR family regulator
MATVTPRDADRFGDAAKLLRALANPVRLAIVDALGDGELCVHELVDALVAGHPMVTQPLVSQHLRVLRSAGLIDGTRRGREVAYRISDTHVSSIANDAVSHAAELAPPG